MVQLKEIKTLKSKYPFKNYKRFNPPLYSKVIKEAKGLRSKTIVHINATPEGGGVVELLSSQIAIERNLGINSYRFYIQAPKKFFQTTKKIHNLLQGMNKSLTRTEKSIYIKINKQLESYLKKVVKKLNPDLVIIHDPQPMPLVNALPKDLPVILRIHGDISEPAESILNFLKGFIKEYTSIIVSSKNYSEPLLFVKNKLSVVQLAIDPLSKKNRKMDLAFAQKISKKYGINCLKPIITQVSRFDPWKDPEGVVKAYYKAKKELPKLQLVLAGIMQAQDDPQALEIYRQIKKITKGDKSIFLFAYPDQLKGINIDIFVSALYTVSTLILQKSLKEGFGLTITEAMWKGKVVIGGNAQGPRLQIKNGSNGIIVDSPDEAGEAIISLLNNSKLRNKLGSAAKGSVRKNFLFPRYILDNLKIYNKIIFKKK